ncbi:MAG: alpha/beta fold hydrolase [Kofleriaceae bacterium]|nr:alpha/beta fold hydrolase [Kofleriaceae bacterium]MCB9574601.1 alpha/beta fold hydrolase [Kofleriaceae bacterium]
MSDRYPLISGAEPWSAPGAGARAGIGIVVSHGFTGNPTATRGVGEALAGRGFAVEVVRLPGHGTHWRDMKATRYVDWRGEVERAAVALHAAGKRVVVAGLSLGGTIALDLAASRGDVLAGAVAINGTVLDRAGVAARLAPVTQLFIPAIPARLAGLAKNDIARGGDEHAYPTVPLKAAYSAMRVLPALRAALPGIAIPVLVAYSPQDHSVSPENSRAVLRALAGKDVTELVLERSFHVATLDHDADLLVDEITRFADRVAGPGAAAAGPA